MTGYRIEKDLLISTMLSAVNKLTGREGCIDRLEKFNKIQLIDKGGMIIDFDEIERIHVEC